MNQQNSAPWFSANARIIFAVILISKVLLSVFTLFQHYDTGIAGSFALCSGDCKSYIGPIENLVNQGSYTPDFRLPGYGAVYLPLYIFFSQPIAADLLVILQILVDIIASFLLVKSIWLLTQNRNATLLGLLFYGIGCTVTVYNKYILTESMAASFLAISFYFIIRNSVQGKKLYILLASLFVVWAYFFRPVFFVLFLLELIYFVVASFRASRYSDLVWFLVPFILLQGSWTLRNYEKKGKVFLLTESQYYPGYSEATIAAWDFNKAFGDYKAQYFFPDEVWMNKSAKPFDIDKVNFPDNIYTRDFNKDSLLELRKAAKFIVSDTVSESDRKLYSDFFVSKIHRYARSLRSNHPFLVYVQTPLKRLYNHTIKSSGVQYLYIKEFSDLTLVEKVIKLFFVLIYQLVLYGVILFVLKTLLIRNTLIYYLLALSCGFALTVHPFLLDTSDVRYLYSFYPLMAIGAALFYGSLKPIKTFANDLTN